MLVNIRKENIRFFEVFRRVDSPLYLFQNHPPSTMHASERTLCHPSLITLFPWALRVGVGVRLENKTGNMTFPRLLSTHHPSLITHHSCLLSPLFPHADVHEKLTNIDQNRHDDPDGQSVQSHMASPLEQQPIRS